MYDKDSERFAKQMGILDLMESLEDDLLKIDGVSEIEFDIRYYNGDYVILIPRYYINPDCDGYFDTKINQLSEILKTCCAHGLLPTDDRIEDYGEHWYIVRKCDPNIWPKIK